ncbi:nuclear distribution protein NUDE family, partial [Trichomonas vaginalis G3]|uniref:nuclear distribution protein NUDE family n=1 Tax=Trichomonas vaginalis (strain ATCC PRA-98 / G3) TaxID=412133 RepID=UPI0021E59EC5
MSSDNMDSAVNAMRALQDRINELQNENEILKHDITILRLNLSAQNSSNMAVDAQLNSKAQTLASELNAVSQSLITLRQLRRDKNDLKELNTKIQAELGQQLRKNILMRNKIKILKSKLDEILGSEDELDAILLQYVLPEPSKSNSHLDIRFNLNMKTKSPNSESAKLQVLLKQVQSLPATPHGESVNFKNEIFSTLYKVKSKIDQLKY